MTQSFKIYIDRLKNEETEEISIIAPSEFIDIHEQDLSFPNPVRIHGEAYLADDHLILHLKIETEALIPCKICNGPVCFPLIIDDFYHTEELSSLKSSVFDYTSPLREALLLNLPAFIECNAGSCPERDTLSHYLKKPDLF